MTRVGIIGCGGMGTHHASLLAKLSNVEIVGTCDLVAAKAESLAKKTGIGRICTDYRELLPDVDAVWICTEPFNRVDIVTTAAKAGKHIFTEKPVALSLADADTMIAATRDAGVVYMLGYVLRFTQPYRLIRDTFASGELGNLVSCWMRRFMPWKPENWYADQNRSGGVMLDFGSHDVDWLRWIGGDVKTVFGNTLQVGDGARADNHGAAIFLFRNGGMATVENSWSSCISESTLGIIGTEGAIVMGSDGTVRKRIGAEGQEQIVDIEVATAVDPKGNIGAEDGEGTIRNVDQRNETIQQHFFRCVEEGIDPLTLAEDGRKTLQTVLALRESAAKGSAVVLPVNGGTTR
jgi:UDP-N-acetylglucosamine 3-dehydrogenase